MGSRRGRPSSAKGWLEADASEIRGLRRGQETCTRPLARRLPRLKPETLHPILNDGDTDGGVAIEATQVRQVVEFFVYAGDEPNRQPDSLLFVG